MIDCHTHWGRAWYERDGVDPSCWLQILDRHHVSHAIVLPEIGLTHAGKISQENESIANTVARTEGRMIPFCTVNPWFEGEAIAELNRALGELGFRGVKFHTWLQGFSVSHPTIDMVCEIASSYDVPILFHDGTPPFSLPSQIALLAKRHPATQIILGHCGLLEHWREAAAALCSTENLWGCLCGPHAQGVRYLIRQAGVSRLLWGSDFGYSLADCYSYRLGLMNTVGLSNVELEQILDKNPKQLLAFG